jgi:WD40 repeat protein
LDSPGDNQFVAFNSDGSVLVSANSAGQIQIWQQVNGTFEATQILKKQQPYSIALNAQGNLLAVATVNNVYIIDTTSGEEVSRIPHKGIVYNVSFSPDGITLATASLKTVQFWDVSTLQKLSTSNIIETACSHLIWNFSETDWNAMFGDQPYKKLCESLPIP